MTGFAWEKIALPKATAPAGGGWLCSWGQMAVSSTTLMSNPKRYSFVTLTVSWVLIANASKELPSAGADTF